MLLSYLGLIFFYLFPVAPPWLAAEKGLISVNRYTAVYPLYFTVYLFINANPVAAMPSLHFAYPFLIFLFSCVCKPLRRFLPLTIFIMLGIGTAIMWLGEHYLTDIIVGVIFASFSFLIVDSIFTQPESKHIIEHGKASS